MLEFLVGILALVFLVNLVFLVLCVLPFVRRRFPKLRRRSLILSIGTFVAFMLLNNQLPETDTIETVATDNNASENTETVPTGNFENVEERPLEVNTAKVEEADRSEEDIPENVQVTFTSDPKGAELFVDRKLEGTTPLTVQVPNGKDINYQLIADQMLYRPFEGTLSATEDESISVWIDRLSAEEVEARKIEAEAAAEKKLREETIEILRDKEVEVRSICKNIVKRSLRAPSTAKFPGIFNTSETYSYDPSLGTAVFTSYVDAQNGFGAMLRNRFACSYSLESNTVTLEYLGE